MWLAAKQGHGQVVQDCLAASCQQRPAGCNGRCWQLLAAGCNIDETFGGRTLLYDAAALGRVKVVRTLLAAG